jgi:Predicted glycosyl hydrolase
MQKKISPILIVVTLIIVVIIVGAITFITNRYKPSTKMADSSQYFGAVATDETTIIINGEISEDKGKVIEGKVYLSEQLVGQYINSRFYWDMHENQMLYTTPYEIIEINDLKQFDDTYYIALDFIKEYTDMLSETFEEPQRTVIFTQEAAFTEGLVIADGAVRVRGGVKSDILRKVAKHEDTVFVLEELDNWIKVLTIDGYTGYIEKEKLELLGTFEIAKTTTDNEYTSILRDHKINLAWHQTMSQSSNEALLDVIKDVTGVNVISPTWFSIVDEDGTISSLASAEYVQQAHEQGLEVWGLIDNFNPDVKTFDVLSHRDKRANIIEQLINIAKEVGLDGINIDLESITVETGPHYVQFLREISIRCRAENLVLSVDIPPPFPYNKHYNIKEQGVVVDYVIIMGYDEHYSGGEAAGSVASLSFVRSGIEETLKDVPKEKVINGIPFYTRVWREPFGSSNITSEVLGMNGADNYIAEHQMKTHWDAYVGQTVAELETEDALYRIWVEDERSIEEKMKLIKEYDLAGVAQWKLGFERSSVWDIIDRYLK